MRLRQLLFALLLAPAMARGTITFVAAGTGGAVTATTCTPTLPAGINEDDVLISVNHSRTNTAHTCSTNCSSVGKGSTSWTVMGTQAGGTTQGRVSIWWLRVANGGLANAPTFGGPATESYACQIFAFRGVKSEGNPHNVVSASTTHAAPTTPFTITGATVTTTVPDCMVVFAGGSMDDNQWGSAGGGVDSTAGYTQNANGTDNSVFLAYDSTPNGTAVGTVTAPTINQTLNGGDAARSHTFALAPPPPSGGMMGFFP